LEFKYNRTRHSAFVVGYLTVFLCLVIMAIVAVTGIIPLSLQPPLMISLLITIIIGGTIGITGWFKSHDRKEYPIMIITLCITLIVVIVWSLTR